MRLLVAVEFELRSYQLHCSYNATIQLNMSETDRLLLAIPCKHDPSLQVVASGRSFLDQYGSLPQLQGHDEGEPLKKLNSAYDSANKSCSNAGAMKIEAMLVHASRSKLKKTQRDLVAAQLAELAGSDLVEENQIHPKLMSFARSTLA